MHSPIFTFTAANLVSLEAQASILFAQKRILLTMAEESVSIYDEVEIEDMTWDETLQIYHYPCPCGDRFEIALVYLQDGEDIAVCPSCSLMIRVVYEAVG